MQLGYFILSKIKQIRDKKISRSYSQQFNNTELKELAKKYRFSQDEIKILEKNYNRISDGQLKVTKDMFRDNMGILGLETVCYLSDRIFDIIDKNKNNYIEFLEFL